MTEMPYNLNKELLNLIRPAEDVGEYKLLNTAGGVNFATSDSSTTEMAVLLAAVSLAAEIKIESTGMLDVVLRKPSKTRSPLVWLQDYVFKTLYYNEVMVGYTGRELKTFVNVSVTDSSKNTVRVSDSEGSYSINRNNIGICRYHMGTIPTTKLRAWRALDTILCEMMAAAPIPQGIVSAEDWDGYLSVLGNNNFRQALEDVAATIKTKKLTLLPKDYKLQTTNAYQDFENYFDLLYRFWCRYYNIPQQLFSIDLPNKTQMTQAAVKGEVVHRVLSPILMNLKDRIEHMAAFAGSTIKFDYSALTRQTQQEMAEYAMKMGQSGVMTINEIREELGLEPIEGGDTIPQTAGAPATEEGSDEQSDVSESEEEV